MKKIVTKKISTKTVAAQIIEALAKGVKIKCRVYNNSVDDGLKAWVVGVCFDSDGSRWYITEEGWSYKYAVPVERKFIVKRAYELVTLFIKEGYTINSAGEITHPDALDRFVPGMWEHCGKEPSEDWNWDPSWLKEEE